MVTKAGDPIWRLSVDQYHAMIETGILPSGSPVELVEGVLLGTISKKPPHTFATEELRAALAAVLPADMFVRTKEPITLGDSEPEPDAIVARGNRRDYLTRHPGVADLALVVEVSDTTLARDRGIKQRVYARTGIPVYWIVDLINRRVEVRTDPQGDGYRSLTVFSAGEALPVAIDGVAAGAPIQVETLFA